jgi:hypothetical protein
MRIPSYQWLMPEQNSNCDFCDEVSISSEFEPKFQILAEQIEHENLFPDGDFETNPFSLITSDDLVFDISSYPSDFNYFTIYINGRAYAIRREDSWPLTNRFDVYTFDNLTIVAVSALSFSSWKEIIKDYLINEIDTVYGTTSSLVGDTFTIENIPSGSYLDDTAYSLLTNINTVSAGSINKLRSGYYNSTTKQINYKNISGASLILEYKATLSNFVFYRNRFEYATIQEFNCILKIIDSSNVEIYSESILLDTSYSGVDITRSFLATGDEEFTYRYRFTPSNIVINNQLALDNFSLNEIEYETLESVEVVNCDNETLEIDYATTIYNGNILVEILESLPNPFQLKFTDSNDNVFYSRWYSIKESDDCDVQFKIDWTNNCKFSDLDYTNLPFTNQLLLTGVKIKNPLEVLDSVDNITPDGRKVSIYKNTQQTFELRLHPYSEETQSTLERIFDHSEVKINDELYNATEAYQTSEVDLGVYTGRVDLYKDGTQVITSSCCC